MKKLNSFVFDTNVVVNAFLSPTSASALALKKAFNRGIVVVSQECMEELTRVITSEKFDKYSSLSKRQVLLIDFENAVSFVHVKHNIIACRDPKDDKFLSLAVSAKANSIITGDNDLLVLNPFRNISILSPNEF